MSSQPPTSHSTANAGGDAFGAAVLVDIAHEFRRHRALAERAIESLNDEGFFQRPTAETNSVALVVKHLAGNLRSRWSDLFASDGEKPTRDRNREFVLEPGDSRTALMAAWAAGWAALESTLAALGPSDLARSIAIRGEPHSVLQALLRGATHAAYHTGQILFLSRVHAPGAPWLTIAPGASASTRGAYLRGHDPAATPAQPRVQRVLETALYVDDLERSVRFYGDTLGLRVMGCSERMASIDAGASTVLLLFRRGASLAGVPTDGGRIPPHDGSGPLHLALAIGSSELEPWRARLVAGGVAIEGDVHWPRGGRSLYVRDPDGHSVELATPGVWEVY